MADLFAALMDQSIWSVLAIIALSFLVVLGCLRLMLRPAMVNSLDPLNIKLWFFLAPALTGFVLLPVLLDSFSQSFFVISFFIAAWLLVIRIAGKPKKIDLRDKMAPDFQIILLLLSIAIIIANVVVNMIIPGKIPLLTEGGVNSRFDATENSRLLTWISFGTAPMAGLIYAVTQNIRVRKVAIVAVIIQACESVLFASKGGILTTVFILLNAWFIAKARKEESRAKEIKKIFLYVSIVIALLAPFYLWVIGVGSGGSALGVISLRFLAGFDQLIFAAHFDLLPHSGFEAAIGSNLFQYQLMPFFKSIFGARYDYSSIGQYVIETVLGIYIEGPFTFPNSNLVLETIFTSGRYLGFIFFMFESLCFYWCRRVSLRRPITHLSLILVSGTVLDPMGLFLSGQEWVTEMVLRLLVILFALILSSTWSAIRIAFKPTLVMGSIKDSHG
ncbi:MAG TPA: hypothetical protein VFE22_14670 [Edaphobacter sp.]|nr:hypothetical protein [Edaphobacter sp.]